MHDEKSRFYLRLPGYKSYILMGVVFVLILMFLIISTNSGQAIPQRIVMCILLIHLVTNLIGMVKLKPWLFLSEIIRIAITLPCIVVFADLPARPYLLVFCVAYHCYCFIKTIWFYRPVADY